MSTHDAVTDEIAGSPGPLSPVLPPQQPGECAKVYKQGHASVDTLFALFSRFLPLAMVDAEQICEMVSNAVSYDKMAETPDFDLMEIVTPTGEHYHIVQGAFSGAGVTYRTMGPDASPLPQPTPPPLPIPA